MSIEVFTLQSIERAEEGRVQMKLPRPFGAILLSHHGGSCQTELDGVLAEFPTSPEKPGAHRPPRDAHDPTR